jgi:hypothetical protein
LGKCVEWLDRNNRLVRFETEANGNETLTVKVQFESDD